MLGGLSAVGVAVSARWASVSRRVESSWTDWTVWRARGARGGGYGGSQVDLVVVLEASSLSQRVVDGAGLCRLVPPPSFSPSPSLAPLPLSPRPSLILVVVPRTLSRPLRFFDRQSRSPATPSFHRRPRLRPILASSRELRARAQVERGNRASPEPVGLGLRRGQLGSARGRGQTPSCSAFASLPPSAVSLIQLSSASTRWASCTFPRPRRSPSAPACGPCSARPASPRRSSRSSSPSSSSSTGRTRRLRGTCVRPRPLSSLCGTLWAIVRGCEPYKS